MTRSIPISSRREQKPPLPRPPMLPTIRSWIIATARKCRNDRTENQNELHDGSADRHFPPVRPLIALDLLNNKITSRSDIESKTSIPVISVIGHNMGTGDIPVFENPKSALSESFRGLRTNLQYLLTEKDQKVVTITSTISGEGKTFCSVNLAAIFAMAGKKTLLMGLDLRKPKIHKIFNIENDRGIIPV